MKRHFAKKLDKILELRLGQWFLLSEIQEKKDKDITYAHVNYLIENPYKGNPLLNVQQKPKPYKYAVTRAGRNYLIDEGFVKRWRKEIFNIQNFGIIVAILASITASVLGIRSCNKESEIENMMKQINSIGNQLDSLKNQYHLREDSLNIYKTYD